MTDNKSAGPSIKRRRSTDAADLPRPDSDDEIEFLNAMTEYQRRNRRPFPTWGEVLSVLRDLGYGKRQRGPGAPGPRPDWRALCSSLLQERDQLQLALAKLHEENEVLKRSLGSLLCKEEVVIDKKAMLQEFGKGPSLTELIAELENDGA
jgi:hypothetical protein